MKTVDLGKVAIGRFKVGDKVIINPSCTVGTIEEGLVLLKEMYVPGIFTIKEVTKSGSYRLAENRGFAYSEGFLLPAPLYKKGDKIQVIPNLRDGMIIRYGYATAIEDYAGTTVTIDEVIVGNYTPDKMGEDGCLYHIDEDGWKWSWSSPMFVLDQKDKFTTKLTTKNYGNEDQLQKEGIAVSRGDQHEGSRICCRRCKAAITVGHLSHQEVSGE